MNLKITSGGLELGEGGAIVLRGAIHPESLQGLQAGSYQREELRDSYIEDMMNTMRAGFLLPDVDLGVRGEHYGCTDDKKGAFLITGPVYIIDGLQRITACRRLLQEGGTPHIGAMVHFATAEAWESNRFDALNQHHIKVSANVLLRNRTATFPALNELYSLCTDESFVLWQRVCWQQFMRREDLLTALTLLRVTMRLHSQFGAGKHSDMKGLCAALGPMSTKVGNKQIAQNMKTFFNLLDGAWGIHGILHKDRATHLCYGFMCALANVLGEHDAFWKGRELQIPRDVAKKVGQFPIKQQNIDAMARGSATATINVLTRLILDHINSGKRTRRLEKPNPFKGGTRVAL